MAGRRVAVQVDGAGRLQDAAHLDDPPRHVGYVRHHRFCVDGLYRRNKLHHDGVPPEQRFQTALVHVLPSPHILETSAGSLVAHQRRIRPLGIERRIEVNQIHRLAVHAVQKTYRQSAVYSRVRLYVRGYGTSLAGSLRSCGSARAHGIATRIKKTPRKERKEASRTSRAYRERLPTRLPGRSLCRRTLVFL